MCGITGGFALTEKGRSAFANIDAANETLIKRGPDGGQVFVCDKVAMGHRRLSIIDTSSAGSQPMQSADKRYMIVFNGEIFNFKELRQKHLTVEEQAQLQSHSDTEIFLNLYAKYRENAFELLRGFFAAAIYDKAEQELVLVRDRFGKKPLLYYQDEDRLLFASEMKAFFAFGIPRRLNRQLLSTYFQLHYVPQPYSLVEGVLKLQPGHYLKVSSKGIVDKAYFRLEVKQENYGRYSYEEAKSRLIELMDEATRLRLIADVPLGAFLSGGIDSSVIVALASRHTDRLKTFSIGFRDNPFFDETHYANLVAKKFKTEHTVFSLTTNDFFDHLYDVLGYLDEPFADSSAIPQFILSYYTRKHVTVALSGDGGDEVFAGYRKHEAEWRMRRGGLISTLIKAGAPVWNILPQSRNNKLTNTFRQLHRFARAANTSAAERYWTWASLTAKEEVNEILPQNGHGTNGFSSLPDQYITHIKGYDFNEVLLADMSLVLLSDMLVKVDSMSMANSLEVRSPFLDQEVVEFAFALPATYKINGQIKKRIVQDAFRSILPAELYNRPKQGFDVPLLNWFRKDLWQEIDNNWLAESFIEAQQIFNLKGIRTLKQKLHSANPGDAAETVWALIVFQSWWRKYMQ
jgi:asparagine synthase (glutamine-hydrolysing)